MFSPYEDVKMSQQWQPHRPTRPPTGEAWRVRRKAVGPALHRAYLEEMLSRVFGPCSLELGTKLRTAAASGAPIDMEACFSQLTLDVIGKSVFNYDFNSLNSNSPLIQV